MSPCLCRMSILGSLALGVGCSSSSSDEGATVFFELDAPLCSSQIPVEFRVDGNLAGIDTFRINLAPDHIRSRGFAVAAGEHLLAARVPGGFVWPDTTVEVSPGQAITRTLPFYCS